MKVALITRATFRSVPGGDTTQVIETARALNALGVDATIVPSGSNTDLSSFDLLHFFNITRPADILRHIKNNSKKFVLTPIWIDYSIYDKYHRKGAAGLLFKNFSPAKIEYVKTIARWIKGRDNHPGWNYIQKGQHKSMQEILEHASLLLTNSDAEYLAIKTIFPHVCDFQKITLGINTELFEPLEGISRQENLVLCAARIEGIKNQYNLVKALNNSPYQLLLVGNPAPNQPEYYEECKKIAQDNVRILPHCAQEELKKLYQQSAVHILPSWYESCGLASLEAVAMGCKIVASYNGFASSYFGDAAYYCDPASPESIRIAIDSAMNSLPDPLLQQKIRSECNWQKAASQTISAYEKVLSKS